MERNGQKLLYQKFIQVSKRMLLYRQIQKIDNDEQKISADVEYNIMSNLLLLLFVYMYNSVLFNMLKKQ